MAQTSGGYADNWTGFYVGAGVGVGAAKFKNEQGSHLYPSGIEQLGSVQNGFTGWNGLASLYSAYDLHLGSGVVAGLVASYDRLKAEYANSSSSFYKFSQHQFASSQTSLGARLGYAASADAMWFVTG